MLQASYLTAVQAEGEWLLKYLQRSFASVYFTVDVVIIIKSVSPDLRCNVGHW